MNAWFDLAAPAWRLAGWTMLHFLWAGTLVALVGAAVRAACRRAAPGVRYGASLVTLVLLAALPVGIAAWLSLQPEFATAPLVNTAAPTPEIASRRDAATWGGFSETAKFESRSDSTTVIDLAKTEATSVRDDVPAGEETTALRSVATGDRARLVPSLRGRGIDAPLDLVVNWLPIVWLVGAPLTFALLAAGLVGSRRLRSGAAAIVEGPVFEACRRLEKSLGIARQVALAACDRLAQPVLVGILRPTILLPASVLTGWSAEELEMVLLHELAHVRRWDNLVNLAQRVVESLLFFHPCVWLVSRQVRRDREECCDAIVVRHTARPEEYASLLVSIAVAVRGRRSRSLATALAAASAMADHPLAGRVRRILKLEEETMHVSRRTLGAMLLLASAVIGGFWYCGGNANAKPPVEPQEMFVEQPTTIYPIAELDGLSPRDWLRFHSWPLPGEGLELAEHGGIYWDEPGQRIIVRGPQSYQDEIKAFLDEARAGSRVRTPEFSKLKADIARFQALLDHADKDLNEIEVLKEMAIEQGNSSSALDAAVQAEMDKDATIAGYRQQLDALNLQIQAMRAAVKDDDPQLKDLQASSKKIDEALERYRAQAEREARDRLAKIPNEAWRIAIVEYKVRQKYLTDKKAEIEAKLKETEARMAELTAGRADTTRESDGAKDDGDGGNPSPNSSLQGTGTLGASGGTSFGSWEAKTIQPPVASGSRLVAYLEVLPREPTHLDTLQELKSLSELMTNELVLGNALSAADGIKLNDPDAVNRLANRLAAQFATDSPILQVVLQCESDPTEHDIAVFSAVLSAYKDELQRRAVATAGDLQDALELRVDADGRIEIDGATIVLRELRERLTKQPKTRRVSLSADAACPYRHVVAVIDACHQAGLRQVSVRGAADVAEGTGGTSPSARGGAEGKPRIARFPDDVSIFEAQGMVNGLRKQGYDAHIVPADDGAGIQLEIRNLKEGQQISWREETLDDGQTSSVLALTSSTLPAQENGQLAPASTGAAIGDNTMGGGLLSDLVSALRQSQSLVNSAEKGDAEALAMLNADRGTELLSALLVPINGNPKEKVTYTLERAPDDFDRRWDALVTAFPLRTLGPRFTWKRTEDGQRYEIRAARAAHGWFRLFFDGRVSLQPAGEGESAARKPYKLHAGDVVKVRVAPKVDDNSLDGSLMVEEEGTLPLGPVFGRVSVAGLTVAEAEAAIGKHLAEIIKEPHVQIWIVQKARTSADELSIEKHDTVGILAGASQVRDDFSRAPEATAAYDVGAQAAEKGKLIDALAAFAEALRHDASFFKAYIAKGDVLKAMTEYQDAVNAYTRALEIDVSQAAAYNGRGECYLEMSPPAYNLALSDFTNALDLDPRNAKARANRDRVRALVGGGGANLSTNSDGTTVPPAGTASPGDATVFLYDGKTFGEWRELSKNELKTERRQEAIEALAAFARSGFGREAAEAIFDVAGKYDFYVIDDSAEGKLKERVLELLTTANAAHVSEADWLPALKARVDADPRKWEWLTVGVLNRLETSDKEARAILVELTGATAEISAAANKALTWLPNLVSEMMKHDTGVGLVGFLEENELGSEEWNVIKLADTDSDNMLVESEILAAPSEALRRVSEWEKIRASGQGGADKPVAR